MFSETMTLISNAQDEFLCSLPSSLTAFWAQLPEKFLISVPKMDCICFPPPLSHKHSHSCPSLWQEAAEGSGLMTIVRRIMLFNFWSEFAAHPALVTSWGSFHPEWFSEMTIHVPWATDQSVCREAATSQLICSHNPALTENVHADRRTHKVRAEAQLPKICFLKRQ